MKRFAVEVPLEESEVPDDLVVLVSSPGYRLLWSEDGNLYTSHGASFKKWFKLEVRTASK